MGKFRYTYYINFFCEPPKPHLATLSHRRPGYSNKTKYDSLITIHHKFYCIHNHNNNIEWERAKDIVEKKGWNWRGGDILVNMYIKYHKGIKRREPVYGVIANIPGS
jgi:hypothetical protein